LTILVRIPSEVSAGAFSLFEEVPPLVDTPVHVHHDEDELFYIDEGRHVVRVGDEEYAVGPGGLVFAPRGVPHFATSSRATREASSFSPRRRLRGVLPGARRSGGGGQHRPGRVRDSLRAVR
jgi:hypothetical protein